jgi:hypothetical protein
VPCRLLYEHRFALDLEDKATESVLGFSGKDAHEGVLKVSVNDLSGHDGKPTLSNPSRNVRRDMAGSA